MRQTTLLRVTLLSISLWEIQAATPNTAASVSVAKSAPSNAEPLVSTHVSFSIEQDRWPDWTGIDSRNEFTHTALVNLQSITGQPPKIRVGANSEDHTLFSPTVTVVEAQFPPSSSLTPYPEATTIHVGDGFYQLSKWLPSGTHMVWGVNFGLDNATNAANMAKSIMKAFSTSEVKRANIHLDLIEVGNEADLYKSNGLRPSNWTQEEYVADWIGMATAVVEAANLSPNSAVGLQGASFAGQGFTPTGIFNDNILQSTPGKVIRQISQHRYSGFFCFGGDFALESFMSKAAVRSNITVFSADIAEVKSKGFPYVLGETNSIACHGAPGVSNTAGAALWAIDYTLQAAVQGIVETYFHEGIGFKYNFIQPVSLNRSITDATPIDPPQPPHVQPAYYSAILVAHAIGSTGSAQIVELTVPFDNVSGYAIYENGRLVRAVFINLDAWLQSSTGTRPSVHIGLTIPSGGPKTATVRRLAIAHADDVSGLTLGGQSYETADGTVDGKETLQNIKVADGVDLTSTEAILVAFH
ncbi:glycoside hydrolase family 79 protein [Hysterangium stoloniferum]|nr:glycoside hydrolase family 79 protein [Hysterangium stoloniferum]